MSGRGRGRGRGGRGGAPMSQSKLLLKRSAVEAGLDEQHAVMDLTRPRLYADFMWHSSGDPAQLMTDPASTDASPSSTPATKELQVTKRSASTRSLVSKQREFMERFQASPHFVRIQQSGDIIRSRSSFSSSSAGASTSYHNHHQPMAPDQLVLESIGKRLATDERYTPLELGPSRLINSKLNMAAASAATSTSKSDKRQHSSNTNLDDLEQKERAKRDDNEKNQADDNEDEGSGAEVDDPLEEEGDDYIQDYYQSDDDSDGGGDGEPVF